MKKLFGTDGMRGEAGEFPLDENTIEIVGSSLARQFREKLGRDAAIYHRTRHARIRRLDRKSILQRSDVSRSTL